MGPDDLVLCSGTLPRGVPYAERLAAASNAGFAAISLWGRDYRAARAEGLTDHDLRSMLDDHGLVVAEVDPAWWWPPGAADIRIDPRHDTEEVFRFGEDELFAVAGAVNARSCNAVDIFGGSWDIDAAAEAFPACANEPGSTDCSFTSNGCPGPTSPIWPPPCRSSGWRPHPTGASTWTPGTSSARAPSSRSWPRFRGT
jgi:hypothetical protein